MCPANVCYASVEGGIVSENRPYVPLRTVETPNLQADFQPSMGNISKIIYKAIDILSTKNSEGLRDLSCVYSGSLEAQIRYHVLTNHRTPFPVSLGPIGASVRVVDLQRITSRVLMLTSHLVSLFRPSINQFFPFFRSFIHFVRPGSRHPFFKP